MTSEDRASPKQLSSLKPAWKFVSPYKAQILAASAALIFTATVTLSIGQGLRFIVDEGLSAGSPEVLRQSIGIFATIVFFLALGTYLRFYFVSWVGERVSADIRNAVYAHLIHLHPAFFERNLPTEIQTRITTDTTLIQSVIGSSASIALRNLLMFLGGTILLFLTNPKLSMVVVLIAPLVVLPIMFFGRRVRRLSRTSQDRVADVGTYAAESLRHIKIVASFNHEEVDLAYFRKRVADAFGIAVQRIRQRAWLTVAVMIVVMSAIATMLWLGGQDVLAGRTSPGELAAFIFYAFIVAGSVGAISEVFGDLQRAAGATERLMELLSARSALKEPTTGKSFRTGSICFQNVSFTYSTRPDVDVLNGLNFEVKDGELVAIVGASGVGKSTILELIQRLYDVTKGNVIVGPHDVREYHLSTLRQNIAYVPQESILFSGTIRDNLRYGAEEASEQEIWQALKSANATFVEAWPDELETIVGEGGQGLSGGERQRISIARALLADPCILLLDEATSALDAESEDSIRETVGNQKGKRTVLVVAHRLSTVIQADRIVVIEDGTIESIGSHEMLLQNSALYRRFAKAQLIEGAA